MANKVFKYIGVQTDGRKVEGDLEAKNVQQVKRLLRRKGRLRKLLFLIMV